MNIDELRRKVARLAAEGRAILDAAEADGRAELTDEEQQRFDEIDAEIDGLNGRIQREERQVVREMQLDQSDHDPIRPDPEDRAGTPAQGDGEKRFASFGEQLRAVVEAARPGGRLDERLSTRAASGASEGVPSDGGFLVQTDFATEILQRAYETGILAPRCRRIPISADANGLKMNAVNETSRANGSRWGGVQTYWVDEADEFTASRPKFRQMELDLKKLTGLFYATDELLRDQNALEAIAREAFAEEFGFKIDDAIIRGTGAGQPLGVLNSSALVSVAKESGQAADTVVYENILSMWSRMWARSRPNAGWFINQDIEPQLYTMSLAVGAGGAPVYLPAGGASGSPYASLMGRPVVPLEQADTLGNQGDIMLLDLSQYLLIDKGGIQSAQSIHVRFLYDEQVFKFIYRVDGQPMWNSALTPYKGTGNTVSPFVTLDARA